VNGMFRIHNPAESAPQPSAEESVFVAVDSRKQTRVMIQL
jgi:hypothetical protein